MRKSNVDEEVFSRYDDLLLYKLGTEFVHLIEIFGHHDSSGTAYRRDVCRRDSGGQVHAGGGLSRTWEKASR